MGLRRLIWPVPLLVLVVGIFWLVRAPRAEPGHAIPAASPTPSRPNSSRPATTTPVESPTDIDGFYEMCDSPKAFSRSPAYQGAAPHPVVLFLNGAAEAAYANDGVTGPGHLTNVDTVQLVACARPDDTGQQTVLRTCQYEGGHSSTLLLTHWRFDVYEARTGRQVTSVSVNGDPNAVCPPVMSFDDGESGTGYDAPPSETSYVLLDALVTGPVH